LRPIRRSSPVEFAEECPLIPSFPSANRTDADFQFRELSDTVTFWKRPAQT